MYSCIGVELNQNLDIRNITKCIHTTNRGQLQCKMLTTGMYYLRGNITVEQFGYTILEPTLTSLNKVRGEQLSKYDVILFKSSENNPDTSGNVCSIHASCLFNPFFRILMPVAILLCSMIVLTIVLFLIHNCANIILRLSIMCVSSYVDMRLLRDFLKYTTY